MAKKSIGQLHAEITANASQFVSEFNRADNAARRSSASIRQSVEKTVRDVQKDFSLPKLSKGFLAGIGIGGGMQLVSTGMEMAVGKISELFQAGAKHAEEMAAAVEEMRKDLTQMHDKRFGSFLDGLAPEKKPEAISLELSKQAQLLSQAEATKSGIESDLAAIGKLSGYYRSGQTVNDITGEITPDQFGGRYGVNMSPAEMGKKAVDAQTAAIKNIEELQQKIADLSKKHADVTDAAATSIRKMAESQFLLGVQAINLGAGRSAAEIRGAITGEEQQAGNNAVLQMRDERVNNAKDYLSRLERDSRIRVDDMTRRGLGTGADYKNVQDQTNNILKEIRDVIRRLESKGLPALLGA